MDDYDLVATASGNPLLPLLPFVAQASDVGLHVLLARRVSGASRSTFEPFMQRIREMGGAGIVLAGDPKEGALLGTARASASLPAAACWSAAANARSWSRSRSAIRPRPSRPWPEGAAAQKWPDWDVVTAPLVAVTVNVSPDVGWTVPEPPACAAKTRFGPGASV